MGVMTEADPAPTRGDQGDDATLGDASIWVQAADHFARWRAGDTRAMDSLVRLLTPVLWHVVRAYGLERGLAEDVVQTTWLTLVRRHDSITEARAVAGWLTTCARREAWRVARAHQRTSPVEPGTLEPHLPADESAESRVETADRDRRLWHAVGTLDDRCRRLLRVIAFEERPDYARIATDLAMPVGSIGPTRGRCLGKLRTALAADGWKDETDG